MSNFKAIIIVTDAPHVKPLINVIKEEIQKLHIDDVETEVIDGAILLNIAPPALDMLLRDILNPDHKPGHITLHTNKGEIQENTDNIIHLSSSGNYTDFHMTDHQTIKESGTLKDFLLKLSSNFRRPHYEHVINIFYIEDFIESPDGRRGDFIMTEGYIVPVSARRKPEFDELILLVRELKKRTTTM